MSTERKIQVDADVYEYIKAHAEPLIDTASSVLRRLLLMKEPKEKKLHWTQTPRGRRIMSALAKKRNLQRSFR